MSREFLDFLDDMISMVDHALTFVHGMTYEQFTKDEKTRFAVLQALEILGEAAKHIPEEVSNHYSNIPWKKISGMRDVLIHGYFGVNIRHVWDTLVDDVPSLREKLRVVRDE